MTVVVLRALGLGDLLTGVPALRALRQAFPDQRLVLAAPAGLAPLARATGAVDEVVDAHGLDTPLPSRLVGAAVAVNLHGRGPQSHHRLLAARPGRLLAFRHPEVTASAGGARWRPGEYEPARWVRMLGAYGIGGDPYDLALDRRRLRADGPGDGQDQRCGSGVPDWVVGATVVHPGSASPARRWPPERWVPVVAHELAVGRRVAVTGGSAERDVARWVCRRAGLDERCCLAGTTDITGLAAVVAAAGRTVSGDTGVAHLATALGTPSVILFGPTPPSEWGPPPGRPRHRVLWEGVPGDPHGASPSAGLLRIMPAQVIDALDDLADLAGVADGALLPEAVADEALPEPA